jgi:chaperonin cofactor prefoldin
MDLALVIVGGIVVVTVITMIGDIAGKAIKSRSATDPKELRELKLRVEQLENQFQDREERIRRLETEIEFANKLLEDKHP